VERTALEVGKFLAALNLPVVPIELRELTSTDEARTELMGWWHTHLTQEQTGQPERMRGHARLLWEQGESECPLCATPLMNPDDDMFARKAAATMMMHDSRWEPVSARGRVKDHSHENGLLLVERRATRDTVIRVVRFGCRSRGPAA